MTSFFVVSHILLWIIVSILSLLCLSLVRFLHDFMSGAEGVIPQGTLIPNLNISNGDLTHSLHDFLGVPFVLVLMRPSCPRCHAVIRTIQGLAASETEYMRLVICIYAGTREQTELFASTLPEEWIRVFADPEAVALVRFGATSTPIVIGVSANGNVIDTLSERKLRLPPRKLKGELRNFFRTLAAASQSA